MTHDLALAIVYSSGDAEIRSILKGLVCLDYAVSLAVVSLETLKAHNEILTMLLVSGTLDKDQIRGSVECLCDNLMNDGTVVSPCSDPWLWDSIIAVKNFFGIAHEMEPARFYFA